MRKTTVLRWGLGISTGLLLLAALAWFGGRAWLGRSVARHHGSLTVAGVLAPIEIDFDARGIPQVWAATNADLDFALGWLHASERLFQMELIRRLVDGRLAEVFGPGAFDTDFEHRRLGFARRGEQALGDLSPQARGRLERYTAGVNAWIAQAPSRPPSLVFLGIQPERWEPEDCLGIADYQTWFSHELMDLERQYHELFATLGDDAHRVLGRYASWSLPTVAGSRSHAGDDTLAAVLAGSHFATASNSWVVSPQRSASGAALHAADPHLQINQAPQLWYLAGLHSVTGTDVVGVTVPGLPFVPMGHNGRAAWSFTVAAVDVIDYFRFRRHPDRPGEVATPGGYQALRSRTEEIRVKGEAEPRRVTVLEAPRGVVVEEADDSVVALHWIGFERSPARVIENGFELARVEDFATFRRLVTDLGALDVNWVYSDRSGHIGYQLGTPVAIRPAAASLTLLDGENPEHGWTGFAPLEATPFAFDPAAGWLASCNNQIVPEEWDPPLPGFFDPYRINRSAELLDGQAQLSSRDLESFQLDVRSQLATRWRPLFAAGAEAGGLPELAAEIRGWDGGMTVDSETAALFSAWWYFMAQEVFEDELEDRWRLGRHALEATLTEDVAELLDDRRTQGVRETSTDLSARAVEAARGRFAGRELGEVSTYTVRHPLARVALLDRWLGLTRGPYPAVGDHTTLLANFRRYRDQPPAFSTGVGPSMRFVLDWADPDALTLGLTIGQSGNPLSPHFDDFLPLWRTGERWTVPFSRDRVEARRAQQLRLLPAAEAPRS